MTFCQNCGKKIINSALFCDNCGEKIDYELKSDIEKKIELSDTGSMNNLDGKGIFCVKTHEKTKKKHKRSSVLIALGLIVFGVLVVAVVLGFIKKLKNDSFQDMIDMCLNRQLFIAKEIAPELYAANVKETEAWKEDWVIGDILNDKYFEEIYWEKGEDRLKNNAERIIFSGKSYTGCEIKINFYIENESVAIIRYLEQRELEQGEGLKIDTNEEIDQSLSAEGKLMRTDVLSSSHLAAFPIFEVGFQYIDEISNGSFSDNKKSRINTEINNVEDTSSAYILPDSDTKEINDAMLEGLSAQELTYARNEIFARHGYVFQSEELNQYFESKSWYKPDSSVTQADVSELEMKNAEYIRQYQKVNLSEYKPN